MVQRPVALKLWRLKSPSSNEFKLRQHNLDSLLITEFAFNLWHSPLETENSTFLDTFSKTQTNQKRFCTFCRQHTLQSVFENANVSVPFAESIQQGVFENTNYQKRFCTFCFHWVCQTKCFCRRCDVVGVRPTCDVVGVRPIDEEEKRKFVDLKRCFSLYF